MFKSLALAALAGVSSAGLITKVIPGAGNKVESYSVPDGEYMQFLWGP